MYFNFKEAHCSDKYVWHTRTHSLLWCRWNRLKEVSTLLFLSHFSHWCQCLQLVNPVPSNSQAQYWPRPETKVRGSPEHSHLPHSQFPLGLTGLYTWVSVWSLSFLKNKFILFIYFWPRWVFVAARGLSLVVVSGGYSSLRCAGFSLRWLLLLRSTGSRWVGFSSCGSRALECRLISCGTWA